MKKTFLPACMFMLFCVNAFSQVSFNPFDPVSYYTHVVYQYKPIRENCAFGQFNGSGNSYISGSNIVRLNDPSNYEISNIGANAIDWDAWPEGNCDQLSALALYDQNAGAGHIYPYMLDYCAGYQDIIPPASVNYIAGSVHAYAFANNKSLTDLYPYTPPLIFSGTATGAAVYSLLKNSGKKFRLKGYRTDFDFVFVPWEIYDVPLNIPSTAQIVDAVATDGYIYIFYYTTTSRLYCLVYDYNGNAINASPYLHNLGNSNTFNFSSFQFYIDGSTVNVVGDGFINGKNRIFIDKFTTTGMSLSSVLPLTGNAQGLVYNMKSEIEKNVYTGTPSIERIYIDAKNTTTGNRVLYELNENTFVLNFMQTMNYTGDYFITTNASSANTYLYTFFTDLATGDILNTNRYSRSASGFQMVASPPTSTVGGAPLSNFIYPDMPPYKVASVIDMGTTVLLNIDAVTPVIGSYGAFTFAVDVTTSFCPKLENAAIDNSISAFPNPFHNTMSVSLNDIADIEIYNLSGVLVASMHHVSGTVQMGEELPMGVYIIKQISADGNVKELKCVKM